MKKLTKILAVCLTVATLATLLIGNSFVSAATTSKNTLNLSRRGIVNAINLDLEDYSAGSGSFASGVSGDNIKYGWSPNLRTGDGESMNITVRQQTGLDGISSNKYISMRRIPRSVHPRGNYVDVKIGNPTAKSHNIMEYSYITFDFDICADEYVYMLDDKEQHGTEIPEGATDVSLAYTSANISMINRDSESNVAGGTSQVYIEKSGTEWYISVGSVKAKLSDVLGAWNHITMVYYINTNAPKPTGAMRYYFNGEFLTEAEFNADTDVFTDCFRIYFVAACYTENSPYFSIGYDNFACNYYEKAYVSGEDVYGIDDYYKDPNHKEKKISLCEDVVFVDSYSYQGTPTPYAVSIKHENAVGEDTFYSINAALAAIKDGDVITLNRNLAEPFTPLHEGEDAIKLLTFKLNDGVKFELNEASKNYYKMQVSDNIITLKYDVSSALTLNWYNAEGEGRETVLTQNLLPLYTPNPAIPELQIFGNTDIATNKKNPTIEILTNWEWDMDGDGIADGTNLRALTVADFLELNEEGIDTISILPKYKTVALAFSVQYVNDAGKYQIYVPNYEYGKMASFANLVDVVAAIDTDKEIIITLYSDLELDAASTISVPAGKKLAIDLNGHTIAQQQTEKGIFTLNEASALSIFSSAKGGKIIANGTGYGVIAADDIDAADINLGARFDANGYIAVPGTNLSISCGSLINLTGSVKGSSNANKINININSGSYVGNVASVLGALIPLTELDLVITINDATVATLTGDPVFMASTQVVDSSKIDVNNSLLASVTPDGNIADLISDWSTTAKATFVASKVLGLDLRMSNITLGESCKLNVKVAVAPEKLKLADGVEAVFATDEPTIEDLIIDTKTITVEYSLLTFKKEVEEAHEEQN